MNTPQPQEILEWCLHNDKAEGGTSKQLDKASVSKESRGGRSPTQETLGIIRGGGLQSFRPTHPAGDPPTRTPLHCNLAGVNIAWHPPPVC